MTVGQVQLFPCYKKKGSLMNYQSINLEERGMEGVFFGKKGWE